MFVRVGAYCVTCFCDIIRCRYPYLYMLYGQHYYEHNNIEQRVIISKTENYILTLFKQFSEIGF